MARAMMSLIALALACSHAQAAEMSESSAANPIRRVVTMIQNIQKKVEAEAEAGEELHNKFMCYCKNGGSDLETSIATAEAKISSVKSALEEAEGEKKQLIADLAMHKSDRAAAEDAIAKATAIRASEAATFAKFKSDSETNVAAIGKAVASLEKGMSGSFLQTNSAQTLRNLLLTKDMQDGDREDVMAFLSGSYAPQSGQITGILKQLGDEMTADLNAAIATEEESISSFNGLVAAKTKEINAATAAIEAKSIRLGEVSVSIAEMTGDLGDTIDSLADDKKFLADLEKNCATAQEKYDAIVKERSAEIVALSETIKILNDDDALELFKKTLPSASASFMQIQEGTGAVRSRALKAVKGVKGLDFIALALNGKKIGFGKVLAMIDEMQVTLKKEQEDDNQKKEYCNAEFDSSDDKKKAEEQAVADAEAAIDDSKETLAKLSEEIKALLDAIAALDKSVSEATAQRQAENADFKEMMAGNTAAKDLIGVAKNRLNKFYNAKLYKAPPNRELSEEERIAVNMGETLAPTPAPGGIAGTGISAFVQDSDAADPGPAPAQAQYGKKSEESGGVIAMLDLLIKDLDKEMQTGETAEKDAQGDYETAMADAATKRADDTKTLGDKESAKAETESALQAHTDDHSAHSTELQGVLKYINSLHAECDWLLQNFDQRKDARTGEIDALEKAKAVLNGADFSLLQTRSLRGRM